MARYRNHGQTSGAMSDNAPYKPRNKDEVLSAMRRELQLEHKSPKTERAYCGAVSEFIEFKLKRRSMLTDEAAIREYLAYLAQDPHCGGEL